MVRTIGRWSLAALMVNTMIGASIFGLPSLIAAHLGKYSPAAYLIAAAGIGVIAACLAEVASQFGETGGPYLYARVAFGQFAGIQIGWLTWLTRIASAAAITNLFIAYFSEFFPLANTAVVRAVIILLLIGFLAAVNYCGVSRGKQPNVDAFRLPGGMLFPGLALLFTGTLATQMHRRELIVLAITIPLALVTWILARRTGSRQLGIGLDS